jgi:hypothetical protein
LGSFSTVTGLYKHIHSSDVAQGGSLDLRSTQANGVSLIVLALVW